MKRMESLVDIVRMPHLVGARKGSQGSKYVDTWIESLVLGWATSRTVKGIVVPF